MSLLVCTLCGFTVPAGDHVGVAILTPETSLADLLGVLGLVIVAYAISAIIHDAISAAGRRRREKNPQ